ncbi:MAG: histidine phosphatase family protein, partial [Rhizobiaceae bacterium]|nr:histidine phosphatase family protein [Rhizobiaceae bacterium]
PRRELRLPEHHGGRIQAINGAVEKSRLAVETAVRSCCRTPAGESMLDVQQRALRYIEALAAENAENRVAVVSHADVIKAVVMHVLGLSVDAWPRFDIAPASVTTIVADDWGAKLITLNDVVS